MSEAKAVDAEISEPEEPATSKRRVRFSLRSLLIVSSLLMVCIALNMDRLRRYFSSGRNVPGSFDPRVGKNVLWKAPLGSQSFGDPVAIDGKVFVGTNNRRGYLDRYPANVDLGVLLCFDASNGKFLWQASSEKLAGGRAVDWPLWGIVSKPAVERDRLWYVTNRCELVCLDTEGFLDDEDDGVKDPTVSQSQDEADVVWKLDMMNDLNVVPHHRSVCSPCVLGNRVFVVTGNAISSHSSMPSPKAASFIAVNKTTGEVLWTDNSPGKNILHGQWGSPAAGVLGGQPQVIFPGGDGWLYSFDPAGDAMGNSKLLWKFDCNPKNAIWKLGGEGTRNHFMNAPTLHDGRVYVAVGQDPEHGEGDGRIWCIDATKRGDVSAELVFNPRSPGKPIPHKRLQACVAAKGDFTKPNPNSAAIWQYVGTDLNKDGKQQFEEEMHRCANRVVVHDDLVFAADFSGLLHCVDAKTGQAHWTYDLLAQVWAAPALSNDHVLIGDEDGDLDAFAISSDPAVAMPSGNPLYSSSARSAIYPTPAIDNNVLYVVSKQTLYAIAKPKK